MRGRGRGACQSPKGQREDQEETTVVMLSATHNLHQEDKGGDRRELSGQGDETSIRNMPLSREATGNPLIRHGTRIKM